MVLNTEDSAGKPPGLQAKTRVGGLLTKLAEKSLDGTLSRGATVLHRYAVLETKFVLDHGIHSPHWRDLDYDSYSQKMREEVADELTARANGNGKPPLGTTQCVLSLTPWLPELFDKILELFPDFRHSYEALVQIKSVYVKPAAQLKGLRAFVRPKVATATEISKNFTVEPGTEVLAQGGGNLYKEKRVLPGAKITNLEINDKIEDFKGKQFKVAMSINSQTQSATMKNNELMQKSGAKIAISVVPDNTKEVAGKRGDRRRKWQEKDDIGLTHYWQKRIRLETPLRINGGEDALFFDFSEITIYGKVLPEKDFRENFDNINAKGFPKMKTPTSVFRGDVFIKPKFNGIPHLFRSKGGTFKIYPRTIDQIKNKGNIILHHENENDNFIFMEGKCDVEMEFVFEMVHGKCHVIRTISYEQVYFKTDSVQRNLALEWSLTIKEGDRRVIKFCGRDNCNCDIDGIFLVSGASETPFKELNERDVLLTDGHMQEFMTEVYDKAAIESVRTRFVPQRFRKGYNDHVVTTPHPTIIIEDYIKYKTEHPRVIIKSFPLPWKLSKATCRTYDKGCNTCAAPSSESCKHGTYCHRHGCDECLVEGTIMCEHKDCTNMKTIYCPYRGNFHCPEHSCRKIDFF